MEYIRAFLVGGIICILVQILMDHTTLQPGRIMVLLVIAGVILGALGIYKRIEAFGGCGATVPLSGFGFSLWKGMKEAIDDQVSRVIRRRIHGSSSWNISSIDLFLSGILDLPAENEEVDNNEIDPGYYFFI